MKIRWERGTNCFLTPLNRSTADDPSAIKPPLDNQPAVSAICCRPNLRNIPSHSIESVPQQNFHPHLLDILIIVWLNTPSRSNEYVRPDIFLLLGQIPL